MVDTRACSPSVRRSFQIRPKMSGVAAPWQGPLRHQATLRTCPQSLGDFEDRQSGEFLAGQHGNQLVSVSYPTLVKRNEQLCMLFRLHRCWLLSPQLTDPRQRCLQHGQVIGTQCSIHPMGNFMDHAGEIGRSLGWTRDTPWNLISNFSQSKSLFQYVFSFHNCHHWCETLLKTRCPRLFSTAKPA